MPFTHADLDALAEGMAPVIREVVIEPMNARIAALEARIAEIEESAASYKGIYSGAIKYRRNSIVTHGGSAWIAIQPCINQRPGDAGGCWVLIAKGLAPPSRPREAA